MTNQCLVELLSVIFRNKKYLLYKIENRIAVVKMLRNYSRNSIEEICIISYF